MGETIFDRVEVLLFRLESYVSEIFRPIPECAIRVKLRAVHLRDTHRVAGEPVEDDKLWIQLSFGNQRLDRAK